MSPLPYCRASELAVKPEDRRWLIELLWAEQGVGILGGEPKSYKSFLALDAAVAVASGTPCLRRFTVTHKGRVLVFAAEDALHVVRNRLAGIAAAAGVALEDLEIDVITAPCVRLDVKDHQRKLRETVEEVRPRLLILDPFVRLHRCDENQANEVAPLLAYLRDLQRQYETAVLLVHHSRKGAAHERGGQALRGSSELHAWGDSNAYIRRRNDALVLTVEHRAAAAPGDFYLELHEEGSALALRVVDKPAAAPTDQGEPTLATRIESALATAKRPLTRKELRDTCKVRMSNLCAALDALVLAGGVSKQSAGLYALSE